MGRTCRNASQNQSQRQDWSAKHIPLCAKEVLSLSRKPKPNGRTKILRLGKRFKRMRISSRVQWPRSAWLMPKWSYTEVPLHTYRALYWLCSLWDQCVFGGGSRKIDWMAWSTSARVNPRSHPRMQVDKTQGPTMLLSKQRATFFRLFSNAKFLKSYFETRFNNVFKRLKWHQNQWHDMVYMWMWSFLHPCGFRGTVRKNALGHQWAAKAGEP